ncbi:ribbon-helix-helix domain-containing protein (plasmid) [Komagataeibacter intermedius]|uniref:ribbon-helix-helix domain-containing protein n=1 Tax=Komagataeibacter intermedius TaxID=66229 RepID=UPI004035B22B
MKRKQCNVTLDADAKAKLDAMSTKTGRSRGELIDDMINMYCDPTSLINEMRDAFVMMRRNQVETGNKISVIERWCVNTDDRYRSVGSVLEKISKYITVVSASIIKGGK